MIEWKTQLAEYLTARGWVRVDTNWWRHPSGEEYQTWDAWHRQCDDDAPEIVAALKETGRL
jgi:hypothetical protein